MRNKDYYKILEVDLDSSQNDIKKSYRRLVLKHHPDTNPGNIYAESYFREVQEAYEILADPIKRLNYNRQIWYNPAFGNKKRRQPVTAESILLESIKLRQFVSTVDSFRMNHYALHFNILEILSDSKMEVLKTYNDRELNSRVVSELVLATRQLQFRFVKSIYTRLEKLALGDPETESFVLKYYETRRKNNYWDRLKPVAVVMVTLLLCFLLYKAAT